MYGKIQTRLAVFAALAALVAVIVPTGLALGTEHLEGNGSDVLKLHMANDGDYFEYGEWMQDIEESKCLIDLVGDDLASFDGTSHQGAGIKDHSIGVKTGNTKGVPCSRVSGSEMLHLSLSALLAEKAIEKAEIDIELKSDAVVELTTYFNGEALETFTLSSGSAASGESGNQAENTADCLSGVSDSGPDSGASDNCRWTISASPPFNAMKFAASSGEFSLEGGGDGTPAAEGSEEYGSDTLFFLVDLDPSITCGETETIADEGVVVSGDVTLHSLDLGDGFETGCEGSEGSIEFLSQVQEGESGPELYFIPTKSLNGECEEEYYEIASESSALGRYTTEIMVEDQEITVEYGQITSLFAEYSPDPCVFFGEGEWFEFGETRDLLPCFGQPVTDPSADGYEAFWTQEDVGLLPDGETACWYFASAEPTSGSDGGGGIDLAEYDGNGAEFIGIETWKIYFEVDPGFRF